MVSLLYKRYGFDDTMIRGYIQNADISDTCVRRDVLADVLMTMIGQHPAVLIGDNDVFVRVLQERITPQSIITRRESMMQVITKMNHADPEMLRDS